MVVSVTRFVRAAYGRLDRLLPRGVPDLVLQLALLEAGYLLYRLVRGWIDDPQGAAVAFENGRTIIELERHVGLFLEPTVQQLAGATGLLSDGASWLYINAQTTVTLGALAYLYLRRNGSFYFVRNMFMVSWVLALCGYVLFPAAPPRFFPEWGFVDSVANFTGVPPTSEVANTLFNPYAAVPSMHVAFALMIGIPLATLARRPAVRWFWRLYPVLVVWVVVVTANHFIFDAVLGALVAGAAATTATLLGMARESWAFAGGTIPVPPLPTNLGPQAETKSAGRIA